MDELERLDEVARVARRERAPEVDVTAAVMARLAQPTPEALAVGGGGDATLGWFASLSAAAAVGVAFCSVEAWQGLDLSLLGLLDALWVVMLV
jgi:hypothetical protein